MKKKDRSNTDTGEKYVADFALEIKNEADDLVARANKTIYVRNKAAT